MTRSSAAPPPAAAADAARTVPFALAGQLPGRLLQSLLHRLFSLRSAGTAVIAFWVFLLLPRPIEDPDIWWHLRNAAAQIQAHAWLRHDGYSFTAAGAPWINHEWLAELPFYLGWRMAGRGGLYAVTLLTLECIFLSLFRLALKKSGDLPASLFVTVLASILSTVSFGPRTLLFGWGLLIVELFVLESFARNPARLFALPLLFALWINTHGSWLIGLVLFVVFILCRLHSVHFGVLRSTRWPASRLCILLTVLLLSGAALFVNPYGWQLVAYPFDLAFHQKLNIASVEEWRSLDFQSVRGLLFLASLGALFLAQLKRRPGAGRIAWAVFELAFLAIGTVSALMHARFLFLAAIVAMPLLARELAALRAPGKSSDQRSIPHWVNAALMLAMLLFALRAASHTSSEAAVHQERFPGTALPFLAAFQPQGRVFNEFLWGGYLAYYAPNIPVFIDSRVDIFERAGVLRDYLNIVRCNNTLALLDKYQIRYVLFERNSALIYLLQQAHGWTPLYHDDAVILLERAGTAFTTLPAPPRTLPRLANSGQRR